MTAVSATFFQPKTLDMLQIRLSFHAYVVLHAVRTNTSHWRNFQVTSLKRIALGVKDETSRDRADHDSRIQGLFQTDEHNRQAQSP